MATIQFGPYELVHRLGNGGMAETYLGIRRGPGDFVQHVCVKRILPALEGDPALVTQFLQEARLAATLRHANIAQVVDFGEVAGSHYLALELVDGTDLRHLLRQLHAGGGRLGEPLTVLIGVAIAGALEHAHGGGRGRVAIVHRDVSASNILVSRSGEVYLTDFGIARPIGPTRTTDTGVVKGKIPYLAPEYVMTGIADARADLFSLGVVLYHALAGRRPFDGATELDTLSRSRAGVHDPVSLAAPGTSPSLVEIVERLIKPRAEDRFQTATALIEALASVAPPATASRALGQLVRDQGQSLSHSFLTGPIATATLPEGRGLAEPDPEVRPAGPHVRTHTAPIQSPPSPSALAGLAETRESLPTFSHEGSYDGPKPTHIPATAERLPALAIEAREPDAAPPFATRDAPEAPGRPRWVWPVLLVLGVLAFLFATVGTYAVVRLITAEGA